MKHNAIHATAQSGQRKKWLWVLLGVFVSFVVLGAVCGMAGYKLYKSKTMRLPP